MSATSALSTLVVAFLLSASGAAGLVYQVAWVRLLGLAFGVTIYAISTVLAAFMGGLAIGSLVGGRRADSAARPLRLYGFVELGVGATALLTPWAFRVLQDVYAGAGSGGGPIAGAAGRWHAARRAGVRRPAGTDGADGRHVAAGGTRRARGAGARSRPRARRRLDHGAAVRDEHGRGDRRVPDFGPGADRLARADGDDRRRGRRQRRGGRRGVAAGGPCWAHGDGSRIPRS